MVTVLEAPPKKSETPDRPASVPEDDQKTPTKSDPDEKQPRIRLKAGLATDPALNMLGSIKSEVGAQLNRLQLGLENKEDVIDMLCFSAGNCQSTNSRISRVYIAGDPVGLGQSRSVISRRLEH